MADWFDPSSNNYFGVLDFDPVRFATKHKPKIRSLRDGRTVIEIHPVDAHLFTECEIIDETEVRHG